MLASAALFSTVVNALVAGGLVGLIGRPWGTGWAWGLGAVAGVCYVAGFVALGYRSYSQSLLVQFVRFPSAND